MQRTFTFEFKTTPDKFIPQIKEKLLQYGGKFEGSRQAGSFEVKEIAGSYTVEDIKLIITITRKPFLAPWPVVESVLKSQIDSISRSIE